MGHVTVYRTPDCYAGWPANYGMWSWSGADGGDEIVLGFSLGYPDPGGGFHRRDRNRPFVNMLARSLDGGLTWRVDECPCPPPGKRGLLSTDEHVVPPWTRHSTAGEAGMRRKL